MNLRGIHMKEESVFEEGILGKRKGGYEQTAKHENDIILLYSCMDLSKNKIK